MKAVSSLYGAIFFNVADARIELYGTWKLMLL